MWTTTSPTSEDGSHHLQVRLSRRTSASSRCPTSKQASQVGPSPQEVNTTRGTQAAQGQQDTLTARATVVKARVGFDGSGGMSTEAVILAKPDTVAANIRVKTLEVYTALKFPDGWFPGDGAAQEFAEKQWRTHFQVQRPEGYYINWYNALAWVKSSWPLAKLPYVPHPGLRVPTEVGTGGMFTEGATDMLDPEAIAIDPSPTANFDWEVLNRQVAGPTRANFEFGFQTWVGDLVLTAEWLVSSPQYSLEYKKNLSHVGGHFADWIVTELFTMGGRKSKYRVVGNGTYGWLLGHMRHLIDDLLSQPAVDYLNRIGDGLTGDLLETTACRMFLNGNTLGLMEMCTTLFWAEASWIFGFSRTQSMYLEARKWTPLPYTERYYDIVLEPKTVVAVEEEDEEQPTGVEVCIPKPTLQPVEASASSTLSWAGWVDQGWNPTTPASSVAEPGVGGGMSTEANIEVSRTIGMTERYDTWMREREREREQPARKGSQ